MATVWIIGEADDHIEAAFTTEGAAEAYLAKIRERDGDRPHYDDHWWVAEVPLDPDAPSARDLLQGLGGLGA